MLGVVPNSIVLMFVRGWRGGTIHQIAAELGITTDDIQTAGMERMGELMRMAQDKWRMEHCDAVEAGFMRQLRAALPAAPNPLADPPEPKEPL